MNIYVCMKQVPDTAADIAIGDDLDLHEAVKQVINPYDEYAIEEAVRTAAKEGGEVVVVTVGKESAKKILRSALSVGADRGIHVVLDDPLPDSQTIARLLETAIVNDGKADLIFTGKQSVDAEGMQTQYRLAGALGIPVATEVSAFALENGKAVVTCEAGSGEQDIVELTLPCVVAATKGLNEPRYPKLPDIMRAGKKEIKVIAADDLNIPPEPTGAKVVKLEPVPDRGQAQILEGPLPDQVRTLVRLLREDKKVL